jgi:glycosyltransferase involved in cell wall biosynthesis
MVPEQTDAPTISVIIPAYNAGAYLHRCLDAIVASDYHSYECIVVNDGSSDESQAVVAQFPLQMLNLCQGPFGPAYARNRGAELARGALVFFVDADVVLAPGALQRVANVFQEQGDLTAVFGSYDAQPEACGLISQYRNLLHHFVHQNGNSEASTFWAGCGAIRRTVFKEVGGFDEKLFSRPSIEDIELGYRLRKAGYRIILDKGLQGTHLKRWSFCSMIRTDVVCRAIPWSRLIQETPKASADLNLQPAQKASVVLAGLACAFLAMAITWPQSLALSVFAVCGVIFLNRKLYAFFAAKRGIRFAVACVPLHLLYYLYSGLSYLYTWGSLRLRRLAMFRSRFPVRTTARSFERRKS